MKCWVRSHLPLNYSWSSVKTIVTIVSYFGNVTASLFVLELNLRLDDPRQKNVNCARVTQSLLIMAKTMVTIK